MTLRLPQLTVISVPLPLTDRRALSQAWYSALHLAAQESPRRENAHRNGAPEFVWADHRARGAVSPASPAAAGLPCGRTRDTRTALGAAPHASERRTAPSLLGRGIARAVARRAPARHFAPFTLTAGSGERVTVVVRAATHGIHLIALCAPSARSAVERALAEARYALGVRGVSVAAELRERSTC